MINKIYHDDAINILKEIPDNSIDMIFTDPPYNTTSLKIDNVNFNLMDYMKSFQRILKPNGWFFCFGSAEMLSILLTIFKFKFQYIWEKPSGMPQHLSYSPLQIHENIWSVIQPELKKISSLYIDKKSLRTKGVAYIRKNGCRVKTQFTVEQGHEKITTINLGYREGVSILRYPNKPVMKFKERTPHPTQKPIDLCKLICNGYCKKGGLILDCFMGSGTIPLAAKLTGRKYIGIEINKEYYDMADKRLRSTL